MKRRLNRVSLNNLDGKKNLIGAEIGVQYGVNAKSILERFDIKTLYLIDPYPRHTGIRGHLNGEVVESIAKKYLKEFDDKIVWIKDYSWNAIFKVPELDFSYIDGDHTYPVVRTDMDLYYPKVKSGGLFAGHDYNRYRRHRGLRRAVNEFFADKDEDLQLGGNQDWWCIKK